MKQKRHMSILEAFPNELIKNKNEKTNPPASTSIVEKIKNRLARHTKKDISDRQQEEDFRQKWRSELESLKLQHTDLFHQAIYLPENTVYHILLPNVVLCSACKIRLEEREIPCLQLQKKKHR